MVAIGATAIVALGLISLSAELPYFDLRAETISADQNTTREANCWVERGDVDFKVCETDVIASHTRTPTRLLWVDNKQVIFDGFAGEKPQKFAPGIRKKHSLYVWTPGQSARVLSEKWDRKVYCAVNGIVKYSIGRKSFPGSRREARLLMYGPIGREKLITDTFRVFENTPTVGVQANKFTCKRAIKKVRKSMRWSPLRTEHGHVEYGSIRDVARSSSPFTLYPPDTPEGIELPMLDGEVSTSCLQYHHYIGAYLFWSCRPPTDPKRLANWKQTDCLRTGWSGLMVEPNAAVFRLGTGPGHPFQ
jgi:hypothetical protein